MPEEITVAIAAEEKVTAILYPAAKGAGIGLILGPGAGAPQTSGFMVTFATELAARGIDTVTFNFPYMEQRRRVPDPNAKLEACYRSVIAAVAQRKIGRGRLAIGGKSMGGRIASQVAAAGAPDVAGLVLLGYPLHPPGKPEQLRTKHLPAIQAPMLFVQGSRDAFGTPEELRPFINKLKAPAELFVVEGGDHSFKVLKRAGVAQADIYKAVQDRIDHWLRAFIR
ncbi:MAG TPA: alpha/beta fold hydrolase [Xanthobacteraceae bacterium]